MEEKKKSLFNTSLSDLFKKKKVKKSKSVISRLKGRKCTIFDFGTYSTKVVRGIIKNKKIYVNKLVEIENPNNQDVLDHSNVADWKLRLKKGLSKNHLRGMGGLALCSLGLKQYIAKEFEIPLTESHEDMLGIVSNEMSHLLTLNVEEYYFQYTVIEEYEKDEKKFAFVRTVAIPRETCDLYFDLLASLGYEPEILDVNSNGMERYIASKLAAGKSRLEAKKEQVASTEDIEVLDEQIEESETDAQMKAREDAKLNAQVDIETEEEVTVLENSTVAFIDYGFRGAEINIFEKGKLVESSNSSCGDIKLVTAVKNVVGISASSVYNGNKLTISETDVYNVLHDSEKYPTNHVFIEVVEELLSNINSIVRRYNSNHVEVPISKIYLCGGSPQLVWLRVYFEKYLTIPAKLVTSTDAMMFPKKLKNSESYIPKYFNALCMLIAE